MKKLIDYTQILRSKNAGPLYVTFDFIFKDRETLDFIVNSGVLTPRLISELYSVSEADVVIIKYEIVNSLKITIPRNVVSGSLEDDDIYGCGMHMPLANLMIQEDIHDKKTIV